MTKSNLIKALFISLFIGNTAHATTYILQANNLNQLESKLTQLSITIIKTTKNYKAIIADVSDSQLQTLQSSVAGFKSYVDINFNVSAAVSSGKKTPPAQPAQSTPWGITDIQADQAKLVSDGAGITVCVVDSGIEKTHPDLVANIAGGTNFVGRGRRINRTDWGDQFGHGTHAAGVIAAADNTIGVVGVAPKASLFASRVFDRNGIGSLSDIADGVLECINVGAQVINLSFEADGDPNIENPLKTAVAQAVAAGINVVAAAGNRGEDISLHIPAGYLGVAAVAAMDQSYSFPAWNNFGLNFDDYTAPGVGINSTYIGSSYMLLDGTSAAAAHVSGVFALKRSSGSLGIVAEDVGYPFYIQGAGKVNALQTVLNK